MQWKPFKQTIRSRTMSSLLVLVISSIILLNVAYYWIIADLLERQAMKDMRQLTHTVSTRLDELVRNLDRIAINIAFSRELLDIVEQNSMLPHDSPERYLGTLRIKQLLQQINELTFIARNIYIYTLDGSLYDYGVNPINPATAYKDEIHNEWLGGALPEGQNFTVSLPQYNPWDDDPSVLIFSLKRPLQQIARTVATIEVQQDYERINAIISSTLMLFKGRIEVSDNAGNRIYPLMEVVPGAAAVGAAKQASSLASPETRHDEAADLITYSLSSEYTGWSVRMSVPKQELFSQTTTYRGLIIMLSVLIIVLFFGVSAMVARRLSAPIVQLHQRIRRITLDYPVIEHPSKYGIAELDQLNAMFQQTILRLQHSHEAIVEAGKREHQAYVKALQAQMNPHFLYNSLATISTLAEEGGDARAAALSIRLAEMLRYSSDHQQPLATIADELAHTRHYLDLLEVRFENSLTVAVHVPDALLPITVPKLSLQPFVENAYLHGVNKKLPPWRISITGAITAGRWEIRIADNGIGIEEETIAELARLGEQALNKPRYSEIGGLGIINTYVRLRQHIGPSFGLAIERAEEGGTVIILHAAYDSQAGT